MKLKAVFFDFGGTIDLYPVIMENVLIAADKMVSTLQKAGIDVSNKYSVKYFINYRLSD